MEIIARIFTGLVGVDHLYILWIEMFAWETSGKKTFKGALPDELFLPTKVMAANQGLYNAFLAAGLIWAFFISDPVWITNLSVCFPGCVVVAGIYGALTISKKIFFTQAVPAILALLFVLLS